MSEGQTGMGAGRAGMGAGRAGTGEEPPGRPRAGERLAALAAIVCLAASVLLVLAGVARNVTHVLVAALGLVLCVLAGLVRDIAPGTRPAGRGRDHGSALALLVSSLIYADISIWRLTLAAVLSLLSVASARYALRRSPAALNSAAKQRNAVTAARHPVLIMNLKSGGGKAERFRLAEECRSRGIETVVLGPGDDLPQLAEDAVAAGRDVIGMAGR